MQKVQSIHCVSKEVFRAWINSLTNLKVSKLLEHATSEVHKMAMGQMRADQVKSSGESLVMLTKIGHYLLTLDEGTQAWKGGCVLHHSKGKYSFCLISSIPSSRGPPWRRFRLCLWHTCFCLVLGVEDKPVLVGGGADGAAMNVGGQCGLNG